MTAEIAIMNRNGIALAADSAVTIDAVYARKIYNTANKLFMFSKYHPVGIMVYGHGDLLGVPWEIIIKIYREKQKKKSCNTIREYAKEFIDFLSKYYSEADQNKFFNSHITNTFRSLIRKEIDKDVDKLYLEQEKISQKQIEDIVEGSIQNCFKEANSWDRIEHLPEEFGKRIVENHEDAIQEIIKSVFENLPISEQGQEKLRVIIRKACTTKISHQQSSGIVIAGYGDTEIFPALYAISINGVIDNHLIYQITHEDTITKEKSATIIPFAQGEMVATFMEGVDPRYDMLIEAYIKSVFDMYPHTLINYLNIRDEEKGDILKALLDVSSQMQKEFNQELAQFKRETFTNPVTNAVSFLPKDELAEMAESLVSLTSFKRRMTIDEETVGGPIDVVIISKGDGFVWIKRKHYFNAEYNHHFFENYYRNCN